MITVILIRHAQSEANIQKHLVGGRSSSTPLSDHGIQQAAQLGEYMQQQRLNPDRVIVSPATRAIETARLSLVELPDAPKVQIVDEINEMSQGAFEGQLRDDVYTAEVKANIGTLGKDFSLPDKGAESMNDVADRMEKFLQQAVSDATDQDVLFVYTHGIAICCYISKLQGLDQQQTFEYIRALPNASLTTLQFAGSQSTPEIVTIGQATDISA